MYNEIFLIESEIKEPVRKKNKKTPKKRNKSKSKSKSIDSKLLEIIEFQNQIRDIYDLDLIINLIANMLEKMIDFKLLAIFGFDKFAKELYILNTRGYYDFKIKNIRIGLSEKSVVSKVALTQRTIYIPDVTKIKYYLNVDSSVKSDVAVPINFNDELLGAIILESDKLDAFSQDDINILEILAENAATVINQHLNEIIVHDLNVLLRNILDLDFFNALEEITKFAEILLHFEIFCILDVRKKNGKFLTQRGYGKKENLPIFERDNKNYFVGQVYLSKEPMYVDNLKKYPDIPYFTVKEEITSEY